MPKFKPWQVIVIALLGLCSFCSICVAGMAALDYMGLLSTEVPEPVSIATDLQIATSLPSKLQPTWTPTLLPTVTELPTNSPVPIPTEVIITLTPVPQGPSYSGPAACIPNNEQSTGLVTKITDGDTIEVAINNTVYPVRYIGMDTPERGDSMSLQATGFNQSLVGGKQVILFRDVSEVDQYNRLLRYVIVDGVFVNYELVRQGYASALTYPPDVACSDVFQQAEQQARLEGVGLWALAPILIPTVTPVVQITVPSRGGGNNCDPSYPTVCIPPKPPDLDCKDVSYKRFQVLPPDPHNFDGDHDGVGCE